ncbi:MAG TPA: hypothetical protein VER11_05400 [Polyangiaceae bacterium]|nr:hypothetical protein [Polyangiaceae bacterium]
MTQRTDVPEDDVGIRPSRSPRITLPAPVTSPAPPAVRCVALFELFRGGAGPVQLGRLHDGRDAPRLVSLRRLANLPTRELEAAANRAQGVTHPRLAKLLGTYQHEDAWYVASEYISGVTLFELGQTAVRQRNPVNAAAAVRIVLDALRVTAEAAQLIEESTISARCLYPESLWISDAGELFVAELLVAPVLARITTGASYVAVTAGMTAQASDVRAAAVELARLACGRLMNGNPASWQTPELPDELSELLARAVTGGPGTENPAAFANALEALDPQLIAGREEVRVEVQRLMGAERTRRQEQLQAMHGQRPESTHVFRVAAAPAVPNFGKASISTNPPDLAAARRARASTLPPPKPPSTQQPPNPTPTIPAPPPTPAPMIDTSDSPISGVWREAHAKMGIPGRRTRRKTSATDLEAMRPPESTVAPVVPVAPVAPVAPEPAPARSGTRRVFVAALVVLVLSAVLGVMWHSHDGSSHTPRPTQQAR